MSESRPDPASTSPAHGVEALEAPGALVPEQLLLQRLSSDVADLQKEVSQMSPELADAAQTLRKLEAHVMVSLSARLAAELNAAVSAAFRHEQVRSSKSSRLRRLVTWTVMLILVGLLIAELRGDYVTLASDAAVKSLMRIDELVREGLLSFPTLLTLAAASAASPAPSPGQDGASPR